MKRGHQSCQRGYTLVEIIIVIVVIAILATIGTVAYSGFQRRAATSAMLNDLNHASSALEATKLRTKSYPDSLPDTFTRSPDVKLSLRHTPGGAQYSGLSAVQNAVLLHEICKQLLSEPEFKTLYSHDKNATNTTYFSWCGSVDSGQSGMVSDIYHINGWNSKQWATPITRADFENRIADPPTDSYWDTATLDSALYRALVDRFEASGGTFPITTTWDSWANEWSGAHYQALPAPDSIRGPGGGWVTEASFCVEATHVKYSDATYHLVSGESPKNGACPAEP